MANVNELNIYPGLATGLLCEAVPHSEVFDNLNFEDLICLW